VGIGGRPAERRRDRPSTVVLCHVADDPEPLDCSPDEWVRDAARHFAAGVRLVRLEPVPRRLTEIYAEKTLAAGMAAAKAMG